VKNLGLGQVLSFTLRCDCASVMNLISNNTRKIALLMCILLGWLPMKCHPWKKSVCCHCWKKDWYS